MRVLFLTRYPMEGASSRYRVFQYLQHLPGNGIRADVQSFMDTEMYRLSLQPGRTGAKITATLRATGRRLWALRRWRRYDVIYLQRELLPYGPPLVERWLARRGARLVYDYDDALFIKKPSRYSRLATWLRSGEKVQAIFRTVRCVVAGNDWLRDAARTMGAQRAETLEVAEDATRVPAAVKRGGPVTIGWLGSPSTSKYLQTIAPVLRDVAGQADVRFELVGGGAFTMPGVDWIETPWSLDGEVAALGRFDIGLMPLPAETWAQGKSGGKARTYMAAGVVPVVSAIGYNCNLIRHGETGFLCQTHEDWRDALLRLIADPASRTRIGAAARRDVQDRFDPAIIARRMATLLHEVRDAA